VSNSSRRPISLSSGMPCSAKARSKQQGSLLDCTPLLRHGAIDQSPTWLYNFQGEFKGSPLHCPALPRQGAIKLSPTSMCPTVLGELPL
jgi:hypothetical protein